MSRPTLPPQLNRTPLRATLTPFQQRVQLLAERLETVSLRKALAWETLGQHALSTLLDTAPHKGRQAGLWLLAALTAFF